MHDSYCHPLVADQFAGRGDGPRRRLRVELVTSFDRHRALFLALYARALRGPDAPYWAAHFARLFLLCWKAER